MTGGIHEHDMSLSQKLWQINWGLLLLVCLLAGVGFAMLYSAANGSLSPWAERQMIRFGVGVVAMLVIAIVDIRVWLGVSYVLFGASLVLLLAVEVTGSVGMGAQRWIDLGFFRLQPSEVVKITMIMALARYFHSLSLEDIARPVNLIAPVLMMAVPVALILRQPDLGTAAMLLVGGTVVFFLAGVRLWNFLVVAVAGLGVTPILWNMLHDYQKQRILTFLNPESDPLGSGYHIIQSKIAMGSGGFFGTGFVHGSQSHLNFLPEKHTDFIFAMLAEEFGFVGGMGLLGLYLVLTLYGLVIAIQSRSQFGKLLGMGFTTIFALYAIVNIAMVMGLLPRGGGATAAGVLWRHGDADHHGGVRPVDECLRAPGGAGAAPLVGPVRLSPLGGVYSHAGAVQKFLQPHPCGGHGGAFSTNIIRRLTRRASSRPSWRGLRIWS